MKTLDTCNRIEVKQTDGTWIKAHWEQIEPDDVIRVYKENMLVQMQAPSGTLTTQMRVTAKTMDVALIDDLADDDQLGDVAVVVAQVQTTSHVVSAESAAIDPRELPNTTYVMPDLEYIDMHDDEEMYVQAMEFLRQFQNNDFDDANLLKSHILDVLEKGCAPQELITAVWCALAEIEAVELAQREGEYGDYDPLEDDGNMGLSQSMVDCEDDEDDVSDMEDLFIPTSECDQVLKSFFGEGAKNRAIAANMKSLGWDCCIEDVQIKREGYTRWMRTLNS